MNERVTLNSVCKNLFCGNPRTGGGTEGAQNNPRREGGTRFIATLRKDTGVIDAKELGALMTDRELEKSEKLHANLCDILHLTDIITD